MIIAMISILTKEKEAYVFFVINQLILDQLFLVTYKTCFSPSRLYGLFFEGYQNQCLLNEAMSASDPLAPMYNVQIGIVTKILASLHFFLDITHYFTRFPVLFFSIIRFTAVFYPLWFNRVMNHKKIVRLMIFSNLFFVILPSFLYIPRQFFTFFESSPNFLVLF